MNTDVYNYMFGSILAMTESDVILSLIVSIVVISLFIIFYRKIFRDKEKTLWIVFSSNITCNS